MADRSGLAIAGARELGVEPFTFVMPAGAWTLALDGSALTVRRGDDGAGARRALRR